jgi:hypothetical protein
VLDRKQHDVGAVRPAVRHRPLGFDHAADAPQMFDELGALGVGRMHHMDTQTPQVTKNLDRHFQFLRRGP